MADNLKVWTITVNELWFGRWAYRASKGFECHVGSVSANDSDNAISCVESKHNIKNGA